MPSRLNTSWHLSGTAHLRYHGLFPELASPYNANTMASKIVVLPAPVSPVIVVHLGGGISITLQYGGKVADIINDEDGPFAPERAGGLPSQDLIKYFGQSGMTAKEMLKKMKSRGGLVAHLGVNDSREVEKMIENGDEHAKLIYDAMALNVARKIGEEAATVAGDVEAIILTGGIAYSEYFTSEVKKNAEWIAPVIVYPGENEMESLALGGLRVLRGQEEAHEFVKTE